MATHSRNFPRESRGQRSLVGCCPQGHTESDRTEVAEHACMHWRRKQRPTLVFFPGESQGWRSLVGCRLWGRTESDTTEVTQQQQQHTWKCISIKIGRQIISEDVDKCLSVQFICSGYPTLCDPMDCSTPGFLVYYQLLELAQAHVHRISDKCTRIHMCSSEFCLLRIHGCIPDVYELFFSSFIFQLLTDNLLTYVCRESVFESSYIVPTIKINRINDFSP